MVSPFCDFAGSGLTTYIGSRRHGAIHFGADGARALLTTNSRYRPGVATFPSGGAVKAPLSANTCADSPRCHGPYEYPAAAIEATCAAVVVQGSMILFAPLSVGPTPGCSACQSAQILSIIA